MITTVLFDLDGTLLPMDQNEFVKEYFKHLARKLAPHGYEAGALVDAVWKGTAAMIRNDGSRSNEDAFWSEFANILGEDALADKPLFDEFYMNEFENARGVCGFNPAAAGTVRALKAAGFRVIAVPDDSAAQDRSAIRALADAWFDDYAQALKAL